MEKTYLTLFYAEKCQKMDDEVKYLVKSKN